MRVHSLPLLTAAILCGLTTPALAELNLPRVSQAASASQTIGTTDLAIKYCRPGVKGRVIWGELVPNDKPWRTGANEATSFTTSDDVKVEGQALPAGTYAIVTIPGTSTWTVAFSKQKDLWTENQYDAAQDQLRVTVTPQPAEAVEWMQFTFDNLATDACELALRWEKLRVPLRIAVDVKGKVMREARAAVAAAAADDWRTPYRAANYANDSDVAPAEVAAWAASALKIKANFFTLSLSAKLARKAGQNQHAIAQMTQAIEQGKADKDIAAGQIAPMEKLLAEWTAKK